MAGLWGQITTRHSWFRMFLGAYGYGAVLLAIAAVVCTIVSIQQSQQASTVETDGVRIWATVVDRRLERGDEDKAYFVTYQVTIDSVAEQTELQVSGPDYADARFPLQQVRYPTDNAALIAKEKARYQAEARRFQTYAFWAGLIGLVWGVLSGRTATAALLARRWGVEEDAYVTERVVRTSTKSLPRVYIRFRSHSGCEGSSFTRTSLTFPDVDRGDYIRVFVHRGRAWWAHDIGTRPQMKARMPAVQRIRKALRLFRTRHQS